MVDNLLTTEEILIMKIQKTFIALGWQWEEQIFNDGNLNNCDIHFTKNTDPCYFIDNSRGDTGWGRFSRYDAWNMAYKELILNKK